MIFKLNIIFITNDEPFLLLKPRKFETENF